MATAPKLTLENNVSFADFMGLLRQLPQADMEAITHANVLMKDLKKKGFDLGEVRSWVEWISGWQARFPVRLRRPRIVLMVADDGVNVETLMAKDAPLYQAGIALDTDLRIYELSGNEELTEEECARAMAYGLMAVEQGIDILGVASYPAASSATTAQKILSALQTKQAPLEILKNSGAKDCAALVGVILAARLARTPIILEGAMAVAAAAVVKALMQGASDHCAFVGDVEGHLSMKAFTTSVPGLALVEAITRLKSSVAACGGDI